MRRLRVIMPIAAGLILIAYFTYGPLVNLLRPCDSIFEQTGPRVEAKLQFIKTKGSVVIGPERVEKLAESAQLVGVHLKACCIMQSSTHMTAEQLQTCIDGAKTYEAHIVRAANLIGEAQTARDEGNTQLANERMTQASQAAERAAAAERELQEGTRPYEPVAPGAEAAILPLAAPSILPLKATILPLKATIVPAARSAPR